MIIHQAWRWMDDENRCQYTISWGFKQHPSEDAGIKSKISPHLWVHQLCRYNDAPGLQTQSRWCHHGLHLLRPVLFFRRSYEKKWCMKKSVEHHFQEAKKAVKDIRTYKTLLFKCVCFWASEKFHCYIWFAWTVPFHSPQARLDFLSRKYEGSVGWGMFLSSYVG